MAKARLKAIICPCCSGTKRSPSIGYDCMWCNGTGRVPVVTALRFADQTEAIGRGGYVCGDHDIDDRNRMVAEARAVRAFVADLTQRSHKGNADG